MRKCTYQVAGHCVNVCCNLFPAPLETLNVCLSTHLAVDTDILGHSLDFIAETRQSVNHVVDGLLEHKDLALCLDFDLLCHITVGNGLRDC